MPRQPCAWGEGGSEVCQSCDITDNRRLGGVCVCVCLCTRCILYQRERERERERMAHIQYTVKHFLNICLPVWGSLCVGVRLYVHIYEREGIHSIQPSIIFYKCLFYPSEAACVCVWDYMYIYIYVREREIQKWHTQYTAMHYVKKKNVLPLWGSMCLCLCVWDFIYIV